MKVILLWNIKRLAQMDEGYKASLLDGWNNYLTEIVRRCADGLKEIVKSCGKILNRYETDESKKEPKKNQKKE